MTNLSGRGPLGLKPAKPERGTTAAKAHMAKVAKLDCIICGARPVEVHHCISGRFGSRKASDFEVLPLCRFCHREAPDAIHQNKAAWEQRNGYDTDFLPIVSQQIGNME